MACRFEQQKRHEIKKPTETVETEKNDTKRSKNITTEIKHLTDRINYITLTKRNDGTEKEFIVETGSPVTLIPPDKDVIKGRKILPVTKKISRR